MNKHEKLQIEYSNVAAWRKRVWVGIVLGLGESRIGDTQAALSSGRRERRCGTHMETMCKSLGRNTEEKTGGFV